MDRIKSVLVEDGEALRMMALHIDLNPVRAGLVEDPKEDRWTGYGEASGGSKRARRGLCKVMEAPLDSWEERRGTMMPAEAYRCWLFRDGLEVGLEMGVEKRLGSVAAERAQRAGLEVSGRLPTSLKLRGPGKSALPSTARPSKLKKGFSKERMEAVLKTGGKLSLADLLLCRVRWFSDGWRSAARPSWKGFSPVAAAPSG